MISKEDFAKIVVFFWSELIYALVADLFHFFFILTASKNRALFSPSSPFLRICAGLLRLVIYGLIDAVLPVDNMTVMSHIFQCISIDPPHIIALIVAIALNAIVSITLPLIWPAPVLTHRNRHAAEAHQRSQMNRRNPFIFHPSPALFNKLLWLPLLEELFYRHFLHRRLSIQSSTFLAYLVVPVWMAINHQPATTLQNVVRIFRALIYGLLYQLSGQIILLPIIAHISNNIIALSLGD